MIKTDENGIRTVVHIDMDGTLAEWKDLIPDIKRMLYEEGTNIKDIEDIIKLPETIKKYTTKIIRQPSYYYDLMPYENVLQFAKELIHEGYDVRISSCYPTKQAYQDKQFWLSDFLPEVPKDKRNLIPDGEGDKKIEYIADIDNPKTIHILIDDHTPNLIGFEKGLIEHNGHGFGIKMFNELNGRHGVWQKATLSNDMSVSELMKAFKGYEEGYKKQMMFHMETAKKLQDIGNLSISDAYEIILLGGDNEDIAKKYPDFENEFYDWLEEKYPEEEYPWKWIRNENEAYIEDWNEDDLAGFIDYKKEELTKELHDKDIDDTALGDEER